MDVTASDRTIDVSSENIQPNRDIILDVDLPPNRCSVVVQAEKYHGNSKLAVLTALTPAESDFVSAIHSPSPIAATTEFVFISELSFHDD